MAACYGQGPHPPSRLARSAASTTPSGGGANVPLLTKSAGLPGFGPHSPRRNARSAASTTPSGGGENVPLLTRSPTQLEAPHASLGVPGVSRPLDGSNGPTVHVPAVSQRNA